jgi:hypothetical protein
MTKEEATKLVPGELYHFQQDEDWYSVFNTWYTFPNNTTAPTDIVMDDGVLLYLGTRKSEEITRYRFLANHHDDMVEHWWLQTGNTSETEVFCFEKDLVYLAISHIKT